MEENFWHALHKEFGTYGKKDKLEALVRIAGMAPSSHNTQPWLFKIYGSTIEILPNFNRRLPDSDPMDRQFYLSLGAAVANLKLAAKALGIICEVKNQPEDQTATVGVFSFTDLEPKLINTNLLKALFGRHTNRYPCEAKELDQNFLNFLGLQSYNDIKLHIVTDPKLKNQLTAITENATEHAFRQKNFTDELSDWIKPSLKKNRDGLVGYNMGVPWLISFALPWAVKYLPMSKIQKKMSRDVLKNASAFGVITVSFDDRPNWLKAGEIFENIAVSAQQNNVKIAVFAAPIEHGEYYKELQGVLQTSDKPVMLFRLGYCDKIPKPAPRIDYKKLLVANEN